MRALRLVVEYDGTHFHGWQFQSDQRTVEGCLRAGLARLSRDAVATAGASRTDTGVHARGQCVLAHLDCELPVERIHRALNSLVPEDLGVRECREADPDFHPRRRAIEKRYLYRITTGSRSPVFGRDYIWWVRGELDVERMHDAAQVFVGEHDFAAFRNRSKDEPESTVRRIRVADCRPTSEGSIVFQVIGDGFLYRMVRNLVGTLVEVGRGRFSREDLRAILAASDRERSGPTAPARGLYLMEVSYPDTSSCELSDSDDAMRW